MCVRIRRFVLFVLQFALATSALSIGLSQAAFAQHILAARAAQTPSSYNWSGFYVGGQIGAGWTRFDWVNFNTVDTEQMNQRGSRVFGGGQLGFQYQWGNTVAGLEVSYVDGFTRGWISSLAVLTVDRTRRTRLGSIWMVTPRLGYTWNRWLGYVKGGYANGEVDFEAFFTSTQRPTAWNYARKSGWIIGAGFDYALIGNLTLGVEYNYVQLNIGGINPTPAPGANIGGFLSNINADVHLFMARLNYKFGGP